MGMTMAGKRKQKNKFWRELRHKGGCCCFGWSVYVPWAFIWAYGHCTTPNCQYGHLLTSLISRVILILRALYVSKLPKCPLICLADLAGGILLVPWCFVLFVLAVCCLLLKFTMAFYGRLLGCMLYVVVVYRNRRPNIEHEHGFPQRLSGL